MEKSESAGEAGRPTASAEIPVSDTHGEANFRKNCWRFTLIPIIDDPYSYGTWQKWIITGIVALAAAVAPAGAAIFYPALPDISKSFTVSETIVNLSVALYMLSMGVFPLWWSSFSETGGRRKVYILSFLLNVIFVCCCGLSTNIAMLIVFRILSGGAAASVQAIGAGTIADIWQPTERGRAMGIFYLGPLVGPLLVPIIAGALTQKFGWRSTMWFLTTLGAAILSLILFILPETLALSKDPIRQRETQLPLTTPRSSIALESTAAGKGRKLTKSFLIDPFSIVAYLRYPVVAVVVYYAAITFGSLYVLNISVQSAFSNQPYNFSTLEIGLIYIPSSLGYIAASIAGGPWIDRIMIRAAVKSQRLDSSGRLICLPEDRMRENAWISANVYPMALICYGWTVEQGVHWIAPSIAMFFYGAGSMLVFSAATTMLTELMPHRASSGVALNNFVRNILGCIGAVIAQPLINAIGHGWLMTLVGLLAWLSGNVCIWLLRKHSPAWRKDMDESIHSR